MTAIQIENERLLEIEERLQGIVLAQVHEIQHLMDEKARLLKVYKAAAWECDNRMVSPGLLQAVREAQAASGAAK